MLEVEPGVWINPRMVVKLGKVSHNGTFLIALSNGSALYCSGGQQLKQRIIRTLNKLNNL